MIARFWLLHRHHLYPPARVSVPKRRFSRCRTTSKVVPIDHPSGASECFFRLQDTAAPRLALSVVAAMVKVPSETSGSHKPQSTSAQPSAPLFVIGFISYTDALSFGCPSSAVSVVSVPIKAALHKISSVVTLSGRSRNPSPSRPPSPTPSHRSNASTIRPSERQVAFSGVKSYEKPLSSSRYNHSHPEFTDVSRMILPAREGQS